MKAKLIIPTFLLSVTVLFSCSTEEENEDENLETPETFVVKYEILGYGEVPRLSYTGNDGGVIVENDPGEDYWEGPGVTLPFTKEIVYTTEIDGEPDASGHVVHGCGSVSVSAYADRSDGRIEEMNVYIDGELKDSQKEGHYYVPGEHWTPWGSASYSYLRRGGDSEKFKCN